MLERSQEPESISIAGRFLQGLQQMPPGRWFILAQHQLSQPEMDLGEVWGVKSQQRIVGANSL